LPNDGGADEARLLSLTSSPTVEAATDDPPIIPISSLLVRDVAATAFIRFFRPLTKVVGGPLPTNDAGMEEDNDTDATLLESPLTTLSFSRFSSSILSLPSSLAEPLSVPPGVMVTTADENQPFVILIRYIM
jgi:hypothetical protein